MVSMLLTMLCRLFFFTGSVSDGSSYPKPLSPEEEARCLELARKGDEAAREKYENRLQCGSA